MWPFRRHRHEWQTTYSSPTIGGWTYYVETCQSCGNARDGIL